MIDFLQHIINPNWILDNGGIWLVLLIVFAETGLFLGCFLPGDSLLFIVGMSLATKEIELFEDFHAGVVLTAVMISIAGILGNAVGYWFGKKSGTLLYQRKDSFFYKKAYLHQAQEFYDKHGAPTIVIARFLPIIRTFAPIIAGIVRMNTRKFAVFNIVGCFAWVFSMILLGFFLGRTFPILQEKIDLVILAIVLVTTVPVFYKILRYRMQQKKKNAQQK